MHIFVDESGVFANPQGAPAAISVVAALVVPDQMHADLDSRLSSLGHTWGLGDAEIKGRELDEVQFSAAWDVLHACRAFAVLVAIDLGLHPDAEITAHRLAQAERITANCGPEFHANIRGHLKALAQRVTDLSNPLYVQMVLMQVMVESVLQLAMLHFPLRHPLELGHFAWRLDAKGDRRTEYEDLWLNLVAPFGQSMSLKNPMIFIEEADYSAFARFDNPDLPEPPNHLKRHAAPGKAFSTFDIKKLMADDLQLQDSRAARGLQAADLVANGFRRACRGSLGPEGWAGIGKLLLLDPRSKQAIHYCQMGPSRPATRLADRPYGQVAIALQRAARSPL